MTVLNPHSNILQCMKSKLYFSLRLGLGIHHLNV